MYLFRDTPYNKHERSHTMLDTSQELLKFISIRINYLRSMCNYSTRELADKAGISLSALYNITSAIKIPNICTLHSI